MTLAWNTDRINVDWQTFNYQSHGYKDQDWSNGGIGWQGVDILTNKNWKKWLYIDNEIKSFGFSNWVNENVLSNSTFEATKIIQGGSKEKPKKHFGSTLFYKSTDHSFSISPTGKL